MLNTTFIKHAQKVMKSAKSRRVLQNIDVRNGYAVVTDSHRLYRIADKNTPEGTYQLDGSQYTDGNYPDTSRLVPDIDDAKYILRAPVKEMYEFANHVTPVHKMLNDHSSTRGYVCLSLDTTNNSLCTATDVNCVFDAEMELQMVTCSDSTIGEVYVQGAFLKEALHLLKDLGYVNAEIYIFSAMKPIVIVAGDVEIILLPVKKQ